MHAKLVTLELQRLLQPSVNWFASDRKRLMIFTDLARAAVIASVPILANLDLLPVWWIYAVAFISSTLSIAFDAADFAAIPSLVRQDDLVTANGRITASYSAARLIG